MVEEDVEAVMDLFNPTPPGVPVRLFLDATTIVYGYMDMDAETKKVTFRGHPCTPRYDVRMEGLTPEQAFVAAIPWPREPGGQESM